MTASPGDPGRRRQHKAALAGLALLAIVIAGGEAPQAAEFTAQGVTLSGEILRATGNTVAIKLDMGAVIMVPQQEIASVRIAIEGAPPVTGRFVDWADGVYMLDAEEGRVRIRNGLLLAVESPAPEPAPAGEAEAGIGGPITPPVEPAPEAEPEPSTRPTVSRRPTM
jgi:hypothetical protein